MIINYYFNDKDNSDIKMVMTTKIKKHVQAIILMLTILIIAMKYAIAADINSLTPPLSVSVIVRDENNTFEYYVLSVKKNLINQGINENFLNNAFENVRYIDRAVKANNNQLEKKVTLDNYLVRILTPAKIKKAKLMYQRNKSALIPIAKQYGISPRYIIALWALESNFGRLQGKEDIISAIVTLAYEGRREQFFLGELNAILAVLQQGRINKNDLKGSWAGAMGQCQFMPSSYLKYGADGDNDGIIDIWNNKHDVFASIANYLHSVGWSKDNHWGTEVSLPANFNKEKLGLEEHKAKTLKEWKKEGVVLRTKQFNSLENKRAWIIIPENVKKRSFLVFDNFQTLMHWNRSYYFAISIGIFADNLIEK